MKDVLITGAFGDVLVIDAHLAPEERRDIRTIYWATSRGRLLLRLWQRLPDYRNARHEDAWRHYDNPDGPQHYVHLGQAVKDGCKLPRTGVHDLSIWALFPDIANRTPGWRYAGSSLLDVTLAEIDHLPLPDQYAVVVPYTPVNKPHFRRLREYTAGDWANTLAWLTRRSLTGVVVNSPCPDPVPVHDRILDLTGRTTLAEAVEVVKRAEWYCGIDSWACILAGMRLDADHLMVLSRNTGFTAWLKCYLPTHSRWPFVRAMIVP